MIPVVILAGGLGTRLYPVTKTIPKSLVPICGTPFIAHQLSLLSQNGVTDVVICIGYLGEQIRALIRDGASWGLNVKYSYDGRSQRGTGGAIKKALPLLPEDFMVIYGDSYLTTSYKNVLRAYCNSDSPCLMTLYKGVNYGLTIFNREVFRDCPDRFDLWDLFNRLQRDGEIENYIVDTPFYEVGSIEGQKKLEEFLCSTL